MPAARALTPEFPPLGDTREAKSKDWELSTAPSDIRMPDRELSLPSAT